MANLDDLLLAQAEQHRERRDDFKELVSTLKDSAIEVRAAHSDHTKSLAEVRQTLAVIQSSGFGPWERRADSAAKVMVLVLLILLLATSRGVSTTEAVDGVARLVPMATTTVTTAATPSSTTVTTTTADPAAPAPAP